MQAIGYHLFPKNGCNAPPTISFLYLKMNIQKALIRAATNTQKTNGFAVAEMTAANQRIYGRRKRKARRKLKTAGRAIATTCYPIYQH